MSAAHQHGHGGGHGGEHGGEHGGGDTTGLHGMLLFGTDPLYLSHLPMFGHPHNFQVILEVAFDDDAEAVLSADREGGDDGMYTFAPAEFPITELDPADAGARTSFEGTIHRGHFERGGPALTPAVATVREVVHFAELDVAAAHDTDQELTYLCFGRPGQFHLAHHVTASPDFDQVLTALMVPGTVTDQAGRPAGQDVTTGFRSAVPVRFAGRKDSPVSRLTSGETARGFFFQSVGPAGSHGFHVDLAVDRQWYLELRELGSV